MDNGNVTLRKKDRIATITISRAQFGNTLSIQTMLELGAIVEQVKKDEEILAVIVTGTDGSFSSGVDLDEMKDMTPDEARRFSCMGSRILRSLELLEKPVIAAVDGNAIGGGLELALACDIRIATYNAKICFPETGFGFIPGFGGTQRLPKIVGAGRAKHILFTGRLVDSQEAMQIGLVNLVVGQKDLMDEAYKMAEAIANRDSLAVKLAKAAIDTGMQLDMDTVLGVEQELFAECFSTECCNNTYNV